MATFDANPGLQQEALWAIGNAAGCLPIFSEFLESTGVLGSVVGIVNRAAAAVSAATAATASQATAAAPIAAAANFCAYDEATVDQAVWVLGNAIGGSRASTRRDWLVECGAFAAVERIAATTTNPALADSTAWFLFKSFVPAFEDQSRVEAMLAAVGETAVAMMRHGSENVASSACKLLALAMENSIPKFAAASSLLFSRELRGAVQRVTAIVANHETGEGLANDALRVLLDATLSLDEELTLALVRCTGVVAALASVAVDAGRGGAACTKACKALGNLAAGDARHVEGLEEAGALRALASVHFSGDHLWATKLEADWALAIALSVACTDAGIYSGTGSGSALERIADPTGNVRAISVLCDSLKSNDVALARFSADAAGTLLSAGARYVRSMVAACRSFADASTAAALAPSSTPTDWIDRAGGGGAIVDPFREEFVRLGGRDALESLQFAIDSETKTLAERAMLTFFDDDDDDAAKGGLADINM
jgi:hypothetical protein